MAPRAIALCLSLMFAIAGAACSPRPDPNRQLQGAIHEAAQMIAEAHYREFLERYMVPAERDRFFPGLDINGKAERFKTIAAARLHQRLVMAETMVPNWSPDHADATFPLDPELHFVRLDGRWYLRN